MRLRLGDTVATRVVNQDEELDFYLVLFPTMTRACLAAAESVVARTAGFVDTRSDPIDASLAQVHDHYAALAETLRAELGRTGSALPQMPSLSTAAKQAVADDDDRVPPFFQRASVSGETAPDWKDVPDFRDPS